MLPFLISNSATSLFGVEPTGRGYVGAGSESVNTAISQLYIADSSLLRSQYLSQYICSVYIFFAHESPIPAFCCHRPITTSRSDWFQRGWFLCESPLRA